MGRLIVGLGLTANAILLLYESVIDFEKIFRNNHLRFL